MAFSLKVAGDPTSLWSRPVSSQFGAIFGQRVPILSHMMAISIVDEFVLPNFAQSFYGYARSARALIRGLETPTERLVSAATIPLLGLMAGGRWRMSKPHG